MLDSRRQGDILRAWREAVGLTLEEAADAVDILATAEKIDAKSRKVPRTHASLSRWETGIVDPKDLGMQIIARAYGVTVEQLRRPPPPPGEAPARVLEVPAEHEASVKAFLKALDVG